MNHMLIVTAVEAERAAILRGLKSTQSIEVIVAGVGMAAAAASTAKALSERVADLVICAGIGGGFRTEIKVGGVAIANEIVAADLGSESQDRFLSVEETNIGWSRVAVDQLRSEKMQDALRVTGISCAYGPILTVNTTTGTKQTANRLAARVPGACAEGMEGFGVATAAKLYQVPCLEVRTISNEVGPRQRDRWRIEEALEQLTKVSSVIEEVCQK